MSAHTIQHLGFLARSVGRDPKDPAGQPATPPAVHDLLNEWRAAERGLAELDPKSDAWARLKTEIESLRQRYQDAFNSMSNSDPTGSSA